MSGLTSPASYRERTPVVVHTNTRGRPRRNPHDFLVVAQAKARGRPSESPRTPTIKPSRCPRETVGAHTNAHTKHHGKARERQPESPRNTTRKPTRTPVGAQAKPRAWVPYQNSREHAWLTTRKSTRKPRDAQAHARRSVAHANDNDLKHHTHECVSQYDILKSYVGSHTGSHRKYNDHLRAAVKNKKTGIPGPFGAKNSNNTEIK